MSNLEGCNLFAIDNFSQLYFMGAQSYEGHVWVSSGKESMASSVVLKINRTCLSHIVI